MGTFETRLDQYAELYVRVGLNVQPGQDVVLGGLSPLVLEHADVARRIAAKAYDAGARQVHVFWSDPLMTRMTLERAADDALAQFPPHMVNWLQEFVDRGAAFGTIHGPNPKLLAGVDPQRIATANQAAARAKQPISRATSSMQVSWSVMAAPTQAWAETVFPHLPAGEREAALWDLIFRACRITGENDPVQAWQVHMAALGERQAYLNRKQFQRLHFRAPGTDLWVELPANHHWLSIAGTTNARGVAFVPNIPSEECFTAPRRDGVNGVVRATLPLNYNGALITGLTLRFERGRVVEYSAESGQEMLKGILETDEGARYLGEVALVPADSPIAQMGTLFYNTLFDENASCHLALGRAYPTSVAGGASMTAEQLAAAGLNQSAAHVDFMIGSPEMEIDAETADGEQVPLFRNGKWA